MSFDLRRVSGSRQPAAWRGRVNGPLPETRNEEKNRIQFPFGSWTVDGYA
ncbi:hypothetical protein [Nocardia arthritidis]|nr:hypothetical protein [Nocardia arthritidis]